MGIHHKNFTMHTHVHIFIAVTVLFTTIPAQCVPKISKSFIKTHVQNAFSNQIPKGFTWALSGSSEGTTYKIYYRKESKRIQSIAIFNVSKIDINSLYQSHIIPKNVMKINEMLLTFQRLYEGNDTISPSGNEMAPSATVSDPEIVFYSNNYPWPLHDSSKLAIRGSAVFYHERDADRKKRLYAVTATQGLPTTFSYLQPPGYQAVTAGAESIQIYRERAGGRTSMYTYIDERLPVNVPMWICKMIMKSKIPQVVKNYVKEANILEKINLENPVYPNVFEDNRENKNLETIEDWAYEDGTSSHCV